jgi:hypothetical protein
LVVRRVDAAVHTGVELGLEVGVGEVQQAALRGTGGAKIFSEKLTSKNAVRPGGMPACYNISSVLF